VGRNRGACRNLVLVLHGQCRDFLNRDFSMWGELSFMQGFLKWGLLENHSWAIFPDLPVESSIPTFRNKTL
jgi:hypothetical protein